MEVGNSVRGNWIFYLGRSVEEQLPASGRVARKPPQATTHAAETQMGMLTGKYKFTLRKFQAKKKAAEAAFEVWV